MVPEWRILFHSQGSNDGKFIQLIAAPTAGKTYNVTVMFSPWMQIYPFK